jgi:type IV pilus assembly protein PilC
MRPTAAAAAKPAAPKAMLSQTQKTAARRRAEFGNKVPGARKIVTTLLPSFSRQLAAMLSAGMSIVGALETLEEQSDNPNFRIVLNRVKRSIENGSSLSEALRQFPSVFDELYANMVRGGETGGKLPETISRLAGFLEASAKLRRKVKSAMMYPIIVLSIALLIATGMIIFIVPVFGSMFKDFGRDLPGPTQFLLDVSVFIKKYGVFILGGLIAGGWMFKQWKATPQGAYAFDGFVLKIPVFGELNRKVACARFAQTFGQLIHSGVPILTALQISAGATGNKVAGKIVLDARSVVEKGEPLSTALFNQTVYPTMFVRMLQAGEKTGKVDEMMDSIAGFYEDEVETMLNDLTSLLEPLLMVFLGVIIGGIVLCMFLPIFKMGEVVGRG